MKIKLILAGILLIGLLLRSYNLSGESLSVDEGVSVWLAQAGQIHILENRAVNFHTPLYFIILHYWVILFGISEFSSRFLSVVLGFFALIMAFKLGSLIFDKETGILNSLFLGVSTFHIYHSQSVRMYSLLTLLTLLSFYFFIKILKKWDFALLVGYLLSSVFLIYTHYSGFFVIFVQNIFLIFTRLLSKDSKFSFRKWFILYFVLIILFIPWIRFVLSKINLKIFIDELSRRQEYIFLWYFRLPVRSINTITDSFFKWSSQTEVLLLIYLISIFLAISYRYIKMVSLLLIWLFVPIALLFLLYSPARYQPQYSTVASLAFYLLAAKGITNIGNKSLKMIVIAVVIIFSCLGLIKYYTLPRNAKWKEAAAYIDTNAKPGEMLLFLNERSVHVFDYYSARSDLNKKLYSEDSVYFDTYASFWIISGKPRRFNKAALDLLNRNYKLISLKEYSGADVITQTLEISLFCYKGDKV